MNNVSEKELEFLIGEEPIDIKVITDNEQDEIIFVCKSGKIITFSHEQGCCEIVYIADQFGDINDLLNNPILSAKEVVTSLQVDCGSSTATFYKFQGPKGYYEVHWKGESNGYYSESVDYSVAIKDDTGKLYYLCVH